MTQTLHSAINRSGPQERKTAANCTDLQS